MKTIHASWLALALLAACSETEAPSPAGQPAKPATPAAEAPEKAPEEAPAAEGRAAGAPTAAQPEAAAPTPEAAAQTAPAPAAPPVAGGTPDAPPPEHLPHGTVVEQPAVPLPPPSAAAEPPSGDPNAGRPKRCEVEMVGKIELPAGAQKPAGDYYIYIADGDCLADDAHIYQRVKAADAGTFFVEEFPICGDPMTLCASVETEEGKPTTWYGKLGREIDDQGEGEVYVPNLVIPIAKGEPHTFPERKGSTH